MRLLPTTMSDLTSKYPHLREESAKLAKSDNETRIKAIQKGFWVPYDRAKEILGDMETLFNHPPIDRMPHMLLVAPSNNGKTQLLKHFLASHPSDPNPNGEAAKYPVIYVAALGPDIGDLCVRILDSVHAPYREKATPAERIRTVTKILGPLNTRVLLLDEINNMTTGGAVKQREFRNGIKDLGNELKISIVAAGVEEASTVFLTDPQLSNRFSPATLPLWSLDKAGGTLLASFERRIPLRKASNLKQAEFLQKLIWMSEGLIGEIYDILKRSAIEAIRSGAEQITLPSLEKIRWIRPSDRRAKPDLA